jgi:ATP-dependent 26S proteasome regulatory subunit
LKTRNLKFDEAVIQAIINQTDGYVFKDIEKIIDRISFDKWKTQTNSNIDSTIELIDLNSTKSILYSYTCINMSETKLYKAKSQLNWNLIGGLESVKKSLTESLIWPIKFKELYHKLSMKQSGGVLLYGPSGCGKTLIAFVFFTLRLNQIFFEVSVCKL